MKKINVLLLTNIDSELNNPYFRLGAFKTYLLPISKQLLTNNIFECKFLLNEHIFIKLKESESILSSDNCFITNDKTLRMRNLDGAITSSYLDQQGIGFENICNYIKETVGEWEPDIILCWESPTYVYRKIFPNCLVLDLMPGFMSRPPYPRTISIDPCGLYKDCWYSKNNSCDLNVEKSQIDLMYSLREIYLDFYKKIKTEEIVSSIVNSSKEATKALAPLQITDYFGFRYNSNYKNQFDFIKDVAINSKEEEIIATQYTGGFVNEMPLNQDNIEYLCKFYKKVLFDEKLNKVDSISQFIIPMVDSVYSVSSTLGLQARFLGKRLISNSCSHLSYLDSRVCNEQKGDMIIAALLTQGSIIYDKAVSEKTYLSNILINILKKKDSNLSGAKLLPDMDIVSSSIEQYYSLSKFIPATRNFKKISDLDIKTQDVIPDKIKQSINSRNVEYISFDIFDTLVTRLVLKPTDVFELMQHKIRKIYANKLPKYFINNFALFRVLAEKLLRDKIDRQLSNGEKVREEFTINDVYLNMELYCHISLPIESFVKLEEEVEYDVIIIKKTGKELYEYALSTGKKIILISDFIHSEKFVEKVLSKCGYHDYKLFLSSSYGLKKDTGNLFVKVKEILQCGFNNILHFGDNPNGDVVQPRKYDIRALRLYPNSFILKNLLSSHNISSNILNDSFVLSCIFNKYAEEYANLNVACNSQIKNLNTLFDSKAENFGFLALGPAMYYFSKWIINKSQEYGIDQILFFARDCYLPYRICSLLCDKLKLVYLPISRKSSTGIDIIKPYDIFNVRIDDFNRNSSIYELLQKRFLFDERMAIDSTLLLKWNIGSIEDEINKIPFYKLYGFIYDEVLLNWPLLEHIYSMRRDNYALYLKCNGIELNKPVITVDFGYKGSIHKKILPIINDQSIHLMFMSYSDGFGESPVENSEAFFEEKCIAKLKNNVCISHNLLLESLVNEEKGTVLNLEFINNNFNDIRDDSLPKKHCTIVKKIHTGTLTFAAKWKKVDSVLDSYDVKIEKDALFMLFSEIVHHPNSDDILILKNIFFDNSFAGISCIPFISSPENICNHSKYLWPEANNIAKKVFQSVNTKRVDVKKVNSFVKSDTDKLLSNSRTKSNISSSNSLSFVVLKPFVRALASERKFNKFLKNPKVFFGDSKKPYLRVFSFLFK
ncbi:hypothetical protein M3084_06490 [Succinatimonas hippei]|uniref:hypothetical protein n=1 Tax=Succinatimonas hippei TaxID=626938 RepID=UPI0020124F05|nr:hypothetical protein [Succinatimonas hippei]MCL1603498.1 hypothetical protein [Succinatimonas hippei]